MGNYNYQRHTSDRIIRLERFKIPEKKLIFFDMSIAYSFLLTIIDRH